MRRVRGVRPSSATLCLLLLGLILAVSRTSRAAPPMETLKVGFIARDGEDADKSEFGPTITALNLELKSRSRQQRLALVKLSLKDVLPEVRAKQIDFLIADPEQYVLAEELGTTAIASLRRKYQGQEVSSYGGVIFGVDGRCNLSPDGKSLLGKIAAVQTTSYAGYGMQKAELARRGISWNEAAVIFTDSHSSVVDSVVAKKADCGFARSGTLEQFAKVWKYKLSRFQGLFLDGQGQNARYIMSTSAVSEWPFAALAHVDPVLVEIIAHGLANVKPYPNPRFKDETLRWSYPLSYASARAEHFLAGPSTKPPPSPEPVPEPPAPTPEPEPIPESAAVDAAADAALAVIPEQPLADATTDALPSAPPRSKEPPPIELFGILAAVLGLVCIIIGAAYLAGRSVGFSRALAADWSEPVERVPTRRNVENNDL